MENPLDRQVASAIFSALKPLMAKAGYQRKENVWYGFSPEIVKLLEFESGSFKPKAYFNLGFAVRTAAGPVQPKASDCQAYGRLDLLCEDLSAICEFKQRESDAETQIQKIVNIVGSVAVPFLDSVRTQADLRAIFSAGKLRGFIIQRDFFAVPSKPSS